MIQCIWWSAAKHESQCVGGLNTEEQCKLDGNADEDAKVIQEQTRI